MNEKAIDLLKKQRDQYAKELRNLEAQSDGVKRAIECSKAKVDALDEAITNITENSPLTQL